MGEAIIVGRGAGGSSGGTLKTEIITESTLWSVPKAKDQLFSVRIFGGGGGGSLGHESWGFDYNRIFGCGGCGGHMNNGMLTLIPGEEISITIGRGGNGGRNNGTYDNGRHIYEYDLETGKNGGTTAFGTYLSATGGVGGHASGGPGWASNRNISHGGSGGGGGGIQYYKNNTTLNAMMSSSGGYGARGEQFGGGGGSAWAGDGGKWGGGGGINDPYSNYTNGRGGTGGKYGGNGGNYQNAATNGTNTIGNDIVPDGVNPLLESCLNLQGAGTAGKYTVGNTGTTSSSYKRGGGGGYGGCGGSFCGGGGGYGGNGGHYGGGGGGYGADGGNGNVTMPVYYINGVQFDSAICAGGGGGGYGKSGKGGDTACDGGYAAGGGGGYGRNNLSIKTINAGNGGNGICIIQYYV